MRARSWAGSDVPSWGTARPAATATSAASSANRFMAQNIHASALMAGRRRLITSPLVSEFVFGTHNAAFVQVMYEQYLRDPASVSDDWRQLFDNGRLAELPVIPTDRAEVLGRGEKGEVPSAAPPRDRKSTRLNSSHSQISYAVFCLKKKKKKKKRNQ